MSVFLCQQSDIPDNEARGLSVGELTFIAVKKQGVLYLYRNSCPHLGLELEWLEHQFLDSSGTYIQCATHGALFDIASGHCVYGPCHGQYLQQVAYYSDGNSIYLADDAVED